MDVIHVPPPPKTAFNKLRPISDLIRAQVNHLKHLEVKLSPEQRQGIPEHRITTEQDAAIYIAEMTRRLRSDVVNYGQKAATIADKNSETTNPQDRRDTASSATSASEPLAHTPTKSARKKKK